MADRYWIAGSAASWSDTANWSTSSGGAGGASVPGSSDTAIFDGNGLGDCTTGGNVSVNSLSITDAYTGDLYSISSNPDFGRTITISAGGSVYVGTNSSVIGGNSSDGEITVAVGTTVVVNGELADSVGFRASRGCSLEGTFRGPLYLGASNENTTIAITGNCLLADITAGQSGFTIEFQTNDHDIGLDGDLSILGTLTWTKGTGTITFSGTADQSVDFDGQSVEDIVVNKPAGTVALAGGVTTDSLTHTAGGLDINGQTLATVGNADFAAGTTIADTAGTGIINVGGNFAATGTSGNEITWTDADLDVTGTATADYVIVSGSDASAGTQITATNSTNNGGNTNWSFGGGGTILPLVYHHFQQMGVYG